MAALTMESTARVVMSPRHASMPIGPPRCGEIASPGISSALMKRWSLLIPLCLGAAALSAGCSTPVDTSGLTRVEMSSAQALPPPYGSAQAVLTSASSLAAFRKALTSDGIGLSGTTTSSAGCTGGIRYSVVLIRSGGRASTTLDAYDCGGQITGNMAGNVSAFLAYVSAQLVAAPSGQG